MKKLFGNPFFLILLGALAIYLAFKGSSDKVLCQGAEMKPSDMCGTLSYADKERSATIFTYGLIAVGGLLIVSSLLRILKRKK